MNFINLHKIPSGKTVIVAIMTYSGYNQEDSIIVNKNGVELGLFRSAKYKKYASEIQKNNTNSKIGTSRKNREKH